MEQNQQINQPDKFTFKNIGENDDEFNKYYLQNYQDNLIPIYDVANNMDYEDRQDYESFYGLNDPQEITVIMKHDHHTPKPQNYINTKKKTAFE